MEGSNQAKPLILNNSHFRTLVVDQLFQTKDKDKHVSWEVIFNAVTIMDKFLAEQPHLKEIGPFRKSEVTIIVITFLRLAAKYEGEHKINISFLAKLFDYKNQDLSSLKRKWTSTQSEVLKRIDCDISWEHCKTFLDESLSEYPDVCFEKQLRVLKILKEGSKYSSELSKNPWMTTDIFQAVVLHRRDPEIIQYIRKVDKWSKGRKKQSELQKKSTSNIVCC